MLGTGQESSGTLPILEKRRQKPNEKPSSMRRGAPADVGVPKNGDSWLPMNAL